MIIECIVALTIVLASFAFFYQAQNYVRMVGHVRPDPSFVHKVLRMMDRPEFVEALAKGNIDPLISVLNTYIEQPKQIYLFDEKSNILFSYSDPEFMEVYAEEVSYSYFFTNSTSHRTFTIILKIS